MDEIGLQVVGISKSFPGVDALQNVSLEIRKGEVHALVGANGAGKTTLVKIVTREIKEDNGEIYLNQADISGCTVREVQELGVAMVPQALNLVQMFTVGQNINLGHEPCSRFGIDSRRLYSKAQQYLEKITNRLDVRNKVQNLSIAEQQLVSVAKALALEPKLLILDEPTASLGDRETEEFFGVLRQLKEEGVSVLYISHRLQEIFDLAERATVLRDGKTVGSFAISELDEEKLIQLIIGQKLSAQITRSKTAVGDEKLRVTNLAVEKRKVHSVSFAVHAGEIVGIVGTLGAGKTEILGAIFGLEPRQAGDIYIDGKLINPAAPDDAIAAGLALIPEERATGLVLDSTVAHNISIAAIDKICALGGWINTKKEDKLAGVLAKQLSIVTPSIHQIVAFLSGGNQQKTVIARWLNAGAKVYLLDEPMKGIDVGSKSEIHALISRLVENGAGVVYATNELDEALAFCDRLIVLHRGCMVAELNVGETNRQELLLCMLGGKRKC